MFTTFEQQHNRYLEPDEPEVFAYDWRGDDIYYGDRYYEIEGDYVLEDDLEYYVKKVFAGDLKVPSCPAYKYYYFDYDPKYYRDDWRGHEVFYGDNYYIIQGDYVLEDDLEDYAKEVLAGELMIAGE